MRKPLRFSSKSGIIDANELQVLQLVASNCTEKLRRIAGRVLAEELNRLYIPEAEIDKTSTI